ncbi:MAG: DUF523 domain-containing protein [Anaeroplasmataceae bacterium]
MKENLLISACLCGCNCKYNGKNNLIDKLDLLKEKYNLIYICPETASGLEMPRDPAEIKNGKVYLKNGLDVTNEFNLGALKTLKKCLSYNCKKALLKESSPSCGVHTIYDGTFSKVKIPGQGVASKLLLENNIELYSEQEVDLLL